MSSPRAAKAVRRAKPAVQHPAKTETATGHGTSERAKQLAKDVQIGVEQGRLDVLTPDAAQALMAAVCKLYAAKIEAGQNILPLAERSSVTATDVMTVASGLLRAVNLAVFELGMWQSWTGR